MSEWPGSDIFAAQIHEAFALPVTYKPGAGVPVPITAIYSNEPAPDFSGGGATLRTVAWEVQQADVGSPRKGDLITGGPDVPLRLQGDWMVIDITRRDDIAAWTLVVERVGG